MKEQFVTYEISLKLKELGFDEECLAIYYKDDDPKELLFSIPEKYSSNPEVAKYQARDAIRQINFDKGWAIKAPLWQQVIDWFRVKYNICVVIQCVNWRLGKQFEGYLCKLQTKEMLDKGDFTKYLHLTDLFVTYEEAREHAILKAIELCQNKK